MTITIATLHLFTPQQVYMHIITHLRKQGVKSTLHMGNLAGERCAYRSGDMTMKCAAGSCIADDEYERGMEGKVWRDVELKGGGGERVPAHHRKLIEHMQDIHDNTNVVVWEQNFRRVSEVLRDLDLTYAPPEAI